MHYVWHRRTSTNLLEAIEKCVRGAFAPFDHRLSCEQKRRNSAGRTSRMQIFREYQQSLQTSTIFSSRMSVTFSRRMADGP